jgi:Ca-activated chloride channel family protein
MALLLLGMARPRVELGSQLDESEGIDIMLVLDFSYSMQEGKLDVGGERVTYIDALRRITRDFIRQRPNDRLGIIGFAVEPYLVSPLTGDHSWVMEMLDGMKLDLGTAIGSAMVAAVDALEQSRRTTRIMVVVTDGNNNIGVSPFQAAKYARAKGIRVYPVEITANRILTPRRIAAHPLYNVAKTARGQFFQATDFGSLSLLYEHVEQLEKSFLKERKTKAYHELFAWFVLPGVLGLLVHFCLAQTVLRRLP